MISDSSDDSNGPSIPRVPVYGPSTRRTPSCTLIRILFTNVTLQYLKLNMYSLTETQSKCQNHTLIKGCVLGLPNVDTWDDILKNFRMRTLGRCIDKWTNGKDYGKDNHQVLHLKGVSSKGPSITSIPKEGPSITRLSKDPIPKVIFKSPTSVKGCMLGLANVETWDNIMKKFGIGHLEDVQISQRGKERFDVEGDERISSLCLISSGT
nr:hypothetical protein [Tanacetum cinerariifolium]